MSAPKPPSPPAHPDPAAAAERRDRLPLGALIALACSTFISVTIEMLPTGLMSVMAPDLGVSEPEIGYLMTVFALMVVLTSAPLTHWLRNVPRHALLIGVLLAFCLGSLGTALAPSYPLILASRVVAGIAHGVFWAVVAAYVALIVPRRSLPRAISITLGGGAVAYVFGVPLGTLLGQLLGWRMAFGSLVVLALAVGVLLWRILPRVDHRDEGNFTGPIALAPASGDDAARSASLGRRLAVPPKTMAAVLLVSGLTAVTMFGQYAFYSYIAPYLTGVVGLPEGMLAPALFAYGALSAVATGAAGALFGERPRLGVLLNLGLCVAVGIAMALFAPGAPGVAFAALAVWGLAMGFLPPMLQARILVVAPSRRRDLASAIYSSCFNVGIGGGSFVGGLVLGGVGITALPVLFAALMAAAVVIALVASSLLARGREAAAAGGLTRPTA